MILDGRPALVVGGGQVGRRKVKGLLDGGAQVELVCQDAVQELAALAAEGRISWKKREWRAGDASGHLLVFACTDDKHVNRAILQDARKAGVPCCCADLNWADGDFTTPATVRMGDLTVAVSTSGQDCRAARDVKNEIAAMLAVRSVPELLVIGTSDAMLPSRKRAPYHLPAEERMALARLVAKVRGVSEFMVLNTCNRVELVAMAAPDDDVEALLKRLAGFDRLLPDEQFSYRGHEAFRHLVRVTAGLESSLLGEFHIVSQVKAAFDEAAGLHWSGAALNALGADVMRVAKMVRHSVEGMLRVAEIDQVAVRYLNVHGGIDARTHVLVIGTGMVGGGVVEALAAMGVKVEWAYHRNIPDTSRFAENIPVLVSMEELPQSLARVDVVVSAVDVSRPVVTAGMCAAVADRNVLFVDLGVPRNIDPFYDEWGHGVTVADLDDLKLWHRVKTGIISDVRARADAIIDASRTERE